MKREMTGFDEPFLRQFQAEQQQLADDLKRRALAAQEAADAAGNELQRRTQHTEAAA